MSRERLISVTTRVSPTTLAKLHALAEEDDRPVTSVIRRMIAESLREMEESTDPARGKIAA